MKATARIRELLGIELPIVQAPMSGYADVEMAIAVSEAGGLGSLPCARLTPDQVHASVEFIRSRTLGPVNLNFFCNRLPRANPELEAAWRARLDAYYTALGVQASNTAAASTGSGTRMPFGEAMCEVLGKLRPRVVSFHFGLPPEALFARVKTFGATIISSATTVEEALWLEAAGCDAIIAQGFEAGGHRGMFLTDDPARQVGTLALVPQIVDAVKVPVIAAGGIGDARGVLAALALGADAVQVGTAYLRCKESKATHIHRRALESARDDSTILTNVLTGRPARGLVNRFIREVGPISELAPEFPIAANAISPLRENAEARDSGDFSQLWAGQAAPMARELSAGELTKMLAGEALDLLRKLRDTYEP